MRLGNVAGCRLACGQEAPVASSSNSRSVHEEVRVTDGPTSPLLWALCVPGTRGTYWGPDKGFMLRAHGLVCRQVLRWDS